MKGYLGVLLTISLMVVMAITLVVTWPRPAGSARPNPIMMMMGGPGGPPPDGGAGGPGGPPPSGPPPGGP